MSLHQEEFRVSLDAFDGPLDLLLYLVRRAEVDIHDISISAIADEYLQVLHDATNVDMEMAGEFLVMAATLVEIKSRSLVPAPKEGEEGLLEDAVGSEEDPRGDLIRQLLSFQRYRLAGEELEDRRVEYARRYPVRSGSVVDEPQDQSIELELEDVHVMDLADAYEHIAAAIDFTRMGEHHVEVDDTPIALCQEDLIDRLQREPSRALTLQSTFEGLAQADRIGMFLATLELVRTCRVAVRQDTAWGEIHIELISVEPSDEAPQAPSEADLATGRGEDPSTPVDQH